MTPSNIIFKTVAMPDLSADWDVIMNALGQKPTTGYCETELDNLNEISNQVACAPGATTTDVAYYIRVSFPVIETGSVFDFKLATDFNIVGLA